MENRIVENHAPDAAQPPRRTKLTGQISLLWMLVSITLVASLIGNLVSTIRLRRATEERDRLRLEVGYLQLGSDGQLSAVRVPADEPLTWKFRVRIPSDSFYRLACGSFWPADSSQPTWTGAQRLGPGEHSLVLRIFSDPRDDRWKLVSVVRSGENTLRFSAELDQRQTKLFRTSNDTLNAGIGSKTVHVDNGQRLRLLDQRWLGGEGGLMLFGEQPPRDDVDGVFLELQPDVGALH